MCSSAKKNLPTPAATAAKDKHPRGCAAEKAPGTGLELFVFLGFGASAPTSVFCKRIYGCPACTTEDVFCTSQF